MIDWIDIQLFPRHPVRKLLVPIDQSSYLICFCYNLFDRAKKPNMYEIKSRTLRSQILTCFIFLVLFSKKSMFHWKKQPFRKKYYSWGRTRLYIEAIGNLENSPRFVFIDEECENLIVVNDGAELTRNINQKKKLTFYSNL